MNGNLKDLGELIIETQNKIKNEFETGDYILSDDFKEILLEDCQNKGENISFNEYTTIIHNRNNQVIYIANQWFVLASFAVDFISEIVKYKEYSDKIVDSIGKEKKEFYPKAKDGNFDVIAEFKNNAVQFCHENKIDLSNAVLLEKFVVDYKWWLGGKTIDRTNDYYVSPALSVLNLINASQEFVAKIVFRYIQNPELMKCVTINHASSFKFSGNQLIISDDNNKSYTLDELAEKLKEMYDDPESSKTAGVQVFAIKYGDIIAENDYSIKEIINKSGLSESYTTVLSDAFTTYKTIKSNHFGLAFADNECMNEVETDSNINDHPSKMSFIRVGAGVGKASEFESFINGNYAGIGWNEIGNLNEIIDKSENPKADIAELLGQIYYSDKTETGRKRVSAKKAGEMLAFFDAKAYENYFVAMKGRRVLAIGQITGDYYFDESKMFGHCRPVDWIKIFSDEQIFLPEDEGYLTTCCDIIKENNIEFLNSLINGNDMPEDEIFFDYEEFKTDKKKYKRNLILHGAPGTGKSYRIEKLRKDLIGDEPNYTRVTFHPDYTYSGFVGTYKPVTLENGENSEITYEYVPGPFMKILTEALMHQDVPYLLIIEEINRANTAAVFGDVFQLLDRDNTGKSQYPVNVSRDMKSYLKKVTEIDFDEIRIPSNMFIWASMNSADQGVYPMDTAFKRRWSFSYIGLNDSEDEMRKYDVILGEKAQQRVNWNKLRNALNDKLTLLGINEDKLLGPFFISEHDMSDEKGFSEVFKDKVISYLFEDAARGKRNKLFKTPVKRYSEICRDFDIRGTEIFDFEDVNTDFSPVSGLAGNE